MKDLADYTAEESARLTPEQFRLGLVASQQLLLWVAAVRDPWLYSRSPEVLSCLADIDSSAGWAESLTPCRHAEILAIRASAHRRCNQLELAQANLNVALRETERCKQKDKLYLQRKLGTEGAEIAARRGDFDEAAVLTAHVAAAWQAGKEESELTSEAREQMHRARRLSALHAFDAALIDDRSYEELHQALERLMSANHDLVMASGTPEWDDIQAWFDCDRGFWLMGERINNSESLALLADKIVAMNAEAAYGYSLKLAIAVNARLKIDPGSLEQGLEMVRELESAKQAMDGPWGPEAMLAGAQIMIQMGRVYEAEVYLEKLIATPYKGPARTIAEQMLRAPH